MQDFGSIGLDANLRAVNSPLNKRQFVPAVNFDTGYEIKGKSMFVSNLIQNSPNGTATGGPFADNTSLTFSTTLTAIDVNGELTFGIPIIAIYTGTAAVAGSQIYPRFGAGIANNDYAINSGYDYHNWDGKTSTFRVGVENNTGGNINIFAVAQWKVINYSGRGSAT